MIVSTPAVVLKRFPYGDTSIIARCFTKDYGKISIIARGARRKKSTSSAHLQPLSYLDLMFYHKPNRDLHTMSKIGFRERWSMIQDDMKKISYGMAILEITDKTLTGEDPHIDLFEEMIHVLRLVDTQPIRLNMVFWYYQLKLLEILGFKPDLKADKFIISTSSGLVKSDNAMNILTYLQTTRISESSFVKEIESFKIPASDRKAISNYLTTHFRIHFDGLGELNAIKVMRQIVQ
ncbi:MAG: DNA repair protein RecO [Candidatus Marinimicrobia bacterium]|jgi:DNA repair protein RecO|nr:DNA repair protein RecO [Candidatus Neomarinimicrobiota bacterium]MBT3617745.1 DNA repair protein RecO [Candidatus Neomarinimicrobiota bacterium]MBT3828380.1 DNA repair protein RecO [Candidatus Neomarinimicrobiota bacterium]MBT3997566.1 DNA repair protein RecO [Candidatus Neomarinimicrobiota bacterium]MBT4280727.1 DNA repair protein RecO [Candidatus Neomarinimicrobiota bacterium]